MNEWGFTIQENLAAFGMSATNLKLKSMRGYVQDGGLLLSNPLSL